MIRPSSAVIAVAGLLLLAPTGSLAASPVEAAFGNTIISTYPSGRSTKLWLNRNGTYEGQRTNGKRTSGTWTVKGAKVCLKQKKPIAIPITFCDSAPKGGVGTRWNSKSPKGEPLKNRLVAGRQ